MNSEKTTLQLLRRKGWTINLKNQIILQGASSAGSR